ncbi:conserved hypothetical protein [Paenibacillus curdlanolyticus YK9]|uniref:Uncharacterized protein n=1 Tax=Paenibacillus curdlanolyticus YK9 TaxID=717606 RepID=E0IFW7_9BACL|nr:hypothetical protein [Paenibacillus curdlanolyticus]EFM08547.1 conserved hypothetical protein [Paenibacillus curdlanolyticus YK9]
MKIFLAISQIIYVISFLPWLLIFGMSFMSFDQGFSVWNLSFVGGIAIYPVAVLLGSILGWVLHKRNKRAAVIWNLVPMLWVVGIISLFLFA